METQTKRYCQTNLECQIHEHICTKIYFISVIFFILGTKNALSRTIKKLIKKLKGEVIKLLFSLDNSERESWIIIWASGLTSGNLRSIWNLETSYRSSFPLVHDLAQMCHLISVLQYRHTYTYLMHEHACQVNTRCKKNHSFQHHLGQLNYPDNFNLLSIGCSDRTC